VRPARPSAANAMPMASPNAAVAARGAPAVVNARTAFVWKHPVF